MESQSSQELVIRIRPGGAVECLHDESLLLEQELEIERVEKAGEVEYDNEQHHWYVRDGRTGELLFVDAKNRQRCLDFEHRHYTERLLGGLRPFDPATE